MKKPVILLSALALTSTVLVGCADGRYVNPRSVGAVAGGVAGGAIGHGITGGSTAGTIAGAVGGTFVGYQLGKSYERRR